MSNMFNKKSFEDEILQGMEKNLVLDTCGKEIEKIAKKTKKKPSKKEDKVSKKNKDLTPEKMVSNLKNYGWVFDLNNSDDFDYSWADDEEYLKDEREQDLAREMHELEEDDEKGFDVELEDNKGFSYEIKSKTYITPVSSRTVNIGRVSDDTGWWKESREFDNYRDAMDWCRAKLRERGHHI